jgi:glucose/mannose-6-phosphate isomerase
VTDPLSVDAVAAVDSTNLVADVLDLPSQLRDALWRVESAMLEPIDAPGGLVVAGMGGSWSLAATGCRPGPRPR